MSPASHERLRALRDRWTSLALESRSVFATWELADTWWAHFGAGSALRVLAAERFLVPLVVERRGPLRILRFVGHGVSDEQGPVCAPAERSGAAAALRDELGEGGWDVFAGELMPADPAWDVLGARAASRPASPVVRFASRDWDAYLATRSGNFRQDVRRTLRKVEQGGAGFRLADAGSLDRDLDTLFALHRERWPNGSDFGDREAFHR
ncbi:MAG: GNAT family N-acetyltransferase, partial [Gaiellaceae bacterium]